MEKIKENKLAKILIGVGISVLITLLGIFIYSIILAYTNIQESTIPVVIIAITCISILIGATITTRKISKNGMIIGGTIGGIYIIIIYLISSIVNTGFNVNIYTVFMIILGIIAGIVGGILGINSWCQRESDFLTKRKNKLGKVINSNFLKNRYS